MNCPNPTQLETVDTTLGPDRLQLLAVNCGQMMAFAAKNDREKTRISLDSIVARADRMVVEHEHDAGGIHAIREIARAPIKEDQEVRAGEDDHEQETASCALIGRALVRGDIPGAKLEMNEFADRTFTDRSRFDQGVLHYTGYVVLACAEYLPVAIRKARRVELDNDYLEMDIGVMGGAEDMPCTMWNVDEEAFPSAGMLDDIRRLEEMDAAEDRANGID